MSVRTLGSFIDVVLLVMLLICGSILPALASYWGRTTQLITLNGVTVPSGQYVPIWWDGGNFYYAGQYTDADHIPKSSIEIVPRWVVQGQGPAEWSNPRCTYYAVQTDPPRAENALLPDDLRLDRPNGYSAHIVYKEGDTYGVQWGEATPEAGYIDITRRVSADCIRFPPGHPFNGLISYVPFKSANEFQDRPIDWNISHHLGLLLLIPLGIIGIFVLVRICAHLVFQLAR